MSNQNANIVFVKRSYESLRTGSFVVPADLTPAIAESSHFISYTNTGAGNVFALKNVTIQPLVTDSKTDGVHVQVKFDPLTDAVALPRSILPLEELARHDSATVLTFPYELVENVPMFEVASHANGNHKNLLALTHHQRLNFRRMRDGMISITDLVYALSDTGIVLEDITPYKTKNNYQISAQLAPHPNMVFILNKDNGVKNESDWPDLARLYVLL